MNLDSFHRSSSNHTLSTQSFRIYAGKSAFHPGAVPRLPIYFQRPVDTFGAFAHRPDTKAAFRGCERKTDAVILDDHQDLFRVNLAVFCDAYTDLIGVCMLADVGEGLL